MFFRHSADKLIYPIIAVVILMLISYHPVYRLRSDMPQGFYAAKERCGPKRPVEQKIACAYWDSAQMNIQWTYTHGRPLPIDVPSEFAIDVPALGPSASSESTRQLYWRRLQEIWYVPDTWSKTYEWSWSWASDPLDSAGQWLRDTIGKL